MWASIACRCTQFCVQKMKNPHVFFGATFQKQFFSRGSRQNPRLWIGSVFTCFLEQVHLL
jgi:hypothetical protein